MDIRFFRPGVVYQEHKEEFDTAIQRVLSNGDLILRQDVTDFEKTLAEYVGTKHAIALNSGTDALYLALRGLGVGPGDKVLVPSRTFVATAQVVVQVGAEPVYYDYEDDVVITGEFAAVIIVHLEGDMHPNMDVIVRDCAHVGVPLIEDACQGLGASQGGRMAGSFGVAGAFSFYPAKTLGAFGDAGGLVTNDDTLAYYVREARNHFKDTNAAWGINSRMDNLQAAVLNIKMKYLPETIGKRAIVAARYDAALTGVVGLSIPPRTTGRTYQDYIVRTQYRDELKDFLTSHGVETLKNNYPFPVPKLPKAQKYEDETLRLPCNETLTIQEVDFIISKVLEFFNTK